MCYLRYPKRQIIFSEKKATKLNIFFLFRINSYFSTSKYACTSRSTLYCIDRVAHCCGAGAGWNQGFGDVEGTGVIIIFFGMIFCLIFLTGFLPRKISLITIIYFPRFFVVFPFSRQGFISLVNTIYFIT